MAVQPTQGDRVSEPIPYQEMRRLCGLPEPTWEMRMQALHCAVRRAEAGLVTALDDFNRVMQEMAVDIRPPNHIPPMWAHNPTRSRRNR